MLTAEAKRRARLRRLLALLGPEAKLTVIELVRQERCRLFVAVLGETT
jgi:hypothetical protein